MQTSLSERLARKARTTKRRQSELVRLALEAFLKETTRAPVIKPIDLVRDLIGSVDSGIPDLGLDFFLRGVFTLVPASAGTLLRANALMEQYRDLPMDYADATLVALAEELHSIRVFTLDRKRFSVYRLYGRRAVDIFP